MAKPKGMGNHGNIPRDKAPPLPKGRPKGAKDRKPRITRSIKDALRTFLDAKGDLLVDQLERALLGISDKRWTVAVQAALGYGIGKPVSADPQRDQRRGVMIVLTKQVDPLRERAKPWKDVDLTLGTGGAVIDAEPAPAAGARAKSPVPAPAKALPPGPLATTASAALEATAKKITTPEHFAEAIPHARRMEGSGWAGDCPACGGRQTLTWTRDSEGGAAEVECEKGCPLSTIIAAVERRLKAARAAAQEAGPARLPRALQSEGEDMVCTSDDEPKFLPPVPSED